MVPSGEAPGSHAAGTLTGMTDLLNLIRGFLMGSADIVPGVSGGTVALVLGIYERLVHAIRAGAGALGSLLRGRLTDARSRLRDVYWRFLLVLLTGILIAALLGGASHLLNPVKLGRAPLTELLMLLIQVLYIGT